MTSPLQQLIETQAKRFDEKLEQDEFHSGFDPDWSKVKSFLTSSTTEGYDLGRKEGAEFVRNWVSKYARRVCTNDATGNERPELAELITSDSLLEQAVEMARTEIETALTEELKKHSV